MTAPTPQEIEALLARVPVRPLVWEETWLARGDGGYDVTGWEAVDCYGDRYVIDTDADGFCLSHNRLINDPVFESLDGAKQCAQDDFDGRIRSSLAPELATALRALADRSYALAVAIMGGEDAPGYADSVDTETLVEQLRQDRRRERDENDRLAAENARFREALMKIACFGDEYAEAFLVASGSYGGFDEPESVKTARAAIYRTGDDNG